MPFGSEFFSSVSIDSIDSRKSDLPNQDRCGCEIFLAKSKHEEILANLCDRINRHIEDNFQYSLAKKEGGSTFSALIYDAKNGNFTVANLGDSRVYCCLKEKGKDRRFMVALTCDDDPNDEIVARKYQKRGGHLVNEGNGAKALSIDAAKVLAVTRSFGDYDFQPHFRTPIIFPSMQKIVELFGKEKGVEVEVEKFLLASDGFTNYDFFLSKKANPHAPFESVSHVKFGETGNFAGFKEVMLKEKSKFFDSAISRNIDLNLDDKFVYKLVNLSRDLRSVDDITIAEVDVNKVRASYIADEDEAAYSPLILSYICDGHGPFGHEYAQAICERVKEFASKTDLFCRNEIALKAGRPRVNADTESLLVDAMQDVKLRQIEIEPAGDFLDDLSDALQEERPAAAVEKPSADSSKKDREHF